MASPGGSVTGSLDQGVSWFSWLFSDHVWPEPDSETRNPKEGFAITLIHGAGVRKLSPRTVTYSRPPSANPPRPLNKSRGCCGSGTSARFAGRDCFGMEGTATCARCDRMICSDNVPC